MHVAQSFTGGGLAIRFYFVMVHYVHGLHSFIAISIF